VPLPTIGQTNWGQPLNDWLLVGHNAEGVNKNIPPAFNVKDYGATGDGTTNDTTSIQAALNAANAAGGGVVWVPKGTYLCNGLVLYANCSIRGTGWASILKQIPAAADNTYLLSAFGSGTSVANNVTNLGVFDLQLLGRCDTDAFTQYVHLLEFSGCSDVLVDRCLFNKWRGDAICIASNLNGGTSAERHNERIRITNCKFDGGNFNNRNGITVIDGTDIQIDSCFFTNCCFTGMPGAIDIEPNNFAYHRVRNIKVLYNEFDTVAGAAGVVGIFFQMSQAFLTIPMKNIKIVGNTFKNCTNISGPIYIHQVQTPTIATERNNILIADNYMNDNAANPIQSEGVRGLRIDRNFIVNSPMSIAFGYAFKNMDTVFSNNEVCKIGTSGGSVFDIYNVERLRIENNIFDTNGDGFSTGRLVSFSGTATSLSVDYIGNRVVGYASVCSSKVGSHTLTANTNKWEGNDTTLAPVIAHFAKQANLTYSRATETGQDAAIRTALAAAKLITDSTTA
jgi:hypothetical protein